MGSSRSVHPSLFEPDTLMQAAELQVLKDEYKRALQEPSWDGEFALAPVHTCIQVRLGPQEIVTRYVATAGYCGLVKVSEDDSILKPTDSALDGISGIDGGLSPAGSEAASQQDAVSEPVGSPLGPAPPGMQFAELTSNQPASVTAGYSGNHDSAEQLLLKLESLQIAEGLSDSGSQGQKTRIAEQAFAEALQKLEQGDVSAAVNLLKVAQVACPANKPQAQARIILLLGRCQQMTGPAKPATAPSASASAKAMPVSQSLPNASHMQAAQTNGHIKQSSSDDVASTQDGDAQKADQSFQCALEALNRYNDVSFVCQLWKVCPALHCSGWKGSWHLG